MSDSTGDRALVYVRKHNVLNLATTGTEGPWCAAVFYANDGFTLYFLSSPASRHSQNVEANSSVSATIQEDYADWPEIKGIQLEGEATRVEGEEEAAVIRRYGEKFPLVGHPEEAPPAIVEALRKVAWYKLVPSRLYFIDNAIEFGHREEVQLT